MKSKTARSSASSQRPKIKKSKRLKEAKAKKPKPDASPRPSLKKDAGLGHALTVGYSPDPDLTPSDQSLVHAFQSNFLSHISHELKTPLMGVINAFTMLQASLEENQVTEQFPAVRESLEMSDRNLKRLQSTLQEFLDLATIESGNLHLRLRELDSEVFLKSVVTQVFPKKGLFKLKSKPNEPFIGDPAKLLRAIEILNGLMEKRVTTGSEGKVQIELDDFDWCFDFDLNPGEVRKWSDQWSESEAGFQAGQAAPHSAFSSLVQNEDAFLRRSEEGLSSGFLLIHEILRLHEARAISEPSDSGVRVRFSFASRDPNSVLKALLKFRLAKLDVMSGSVRSFSLGLATRNRDLASAEGSRGPLFVDQIRKKLFRSNDTILFWPGQDSEAQGEERVVLILEDCTRKDLPSVTSRIDELKPMKMGWVSVPEDGLEPSELIELLRTRFGGF